MTAARELGEARQAARELGEARPAAREREEARPAAREREGAHREGPARRVVVARPPSAPSICAPA
jgi:hypothetical protein